MYVNARIERGDRQAYVVPKESVVSFNDVSYVLVFERQKSENGKPFTEYRFIKIRAGASREGMIEISPLEEVDLQQAKLVIKGAYALLSAKRNAGEMTCG
jgi:cobalt-zinc-cadmium efflux system membrane fusion protein